MADHLQQHPAGAGNSKKTFPGYQSTRRAASGRLWTGQIQNRKTLLPEGVAKATLIRTLALEPELLLLDEPFSALDYQTRLSVSDDIGTIICREGKTAVLVTHDISEAKSVCETGKDCIQPETCAHTKIIPITFSMPVAKTPYGFLKCP